MTDVGAATPTTDLAGDRLRAHVEAVVAAAGVPRSQRDDLAEELLGHLEERTEALVAQGVSREDAVRLAVDAFGSADALAGDFARAFHSRLWASTIGVLLASTQRGDDRPQVVGWLRLVLVLSMAFTAAALVITAASASFGWVVVLSIVYVLALVSQLLAYEALDRGHRWALWYALAVTVSFLVWGIWSVISPDIPGTITIPLGGILAAAVLLSANAATPRLRAFVASSRPINRSLAWGLAAVFLLQNGAPAARAFLADPTQASASDVEVRWSMTCDRGDIVTDSEPLRDVLRITVEADVVLRRTDPLPDGIAGALNPHSYGDTAGYAVVETDAGAGGDGYSWFLVSNEDPLDLATGTTVGSFGGTSPSVGLLPEQVQGSFTVAYENAIVEPGHHVRARWTLAPASVEEPAWPRIKTYYAHLDRFLLTTHVGCGETSLARPQGT